MESGTSINDTVTSREVPGNRFNCGDLYIEKQTDVNHNEQNCDKKERFMDESVNKCVTDNEADQIPPGFIEIDSVPKSHDNAQQNKDLHQPGVSAMKQEDMSFAAGSLETKVQRGQEFAAGETRQATQEMRTGVNSHESAASKSAAQATGETKAELNFVSDDPKENSDNFDSRWDYLRRVTVQGNNFEVLRGLWGNAKFPDPSVNLTHFQFLNSERRPLRKNHSVGKSSRSKGKSKPYTCVSHMKKLMNDARNEYGTNLVKLYKKQSRLFSEMLDRHESEFLKATRSLCVNGRVYSDDIDIVIRKQNAERNESYLKFSNRVKQLMQSTRSTLQHYEKLEGEIIDFHKQYKKDGELWLNDEQILNFEETERMYEDFVKFYR